MACALQGAFGAILKHALRSAGCQPVGLWGRWTLLAVVAAALASACGGGGGSQAERDLRDRLAGTWVWKRPGPAYTTSIVLEMDRKGRFTERTYAEVRGQQRLLYIKRITNDIQLEPDDPAKREELKRQGFEPSIATGRFEVKVSPNGNTIAFLSQSAQARDQALDSQHVLLRLDRGDNLLTIGGRLYQRDQAVAR